MAFTKMAAANDKKAAAAPLQPAKGARASAGGAAAMDLGISGVGLSVGGSAIKRPAAAPAAPAGAAAGAASSGTAHFSGKENKQQQGQAQARPAGAPGAGATGAAGAGASAGAGAGAGGASSIAVVMSDDGDDTGFGGLGGDAADTDESDFTIAGDAAVSADDQFFDAVVGALQDLIMDDGFNAFQRGLLDAHCDEFDANESESKLSHHRVFKAYVAALEQRIDEWLRARVQGFAMPRFLALLSDRKDELCGDVMDMLSGIADFTVFRDTVLTHKAEKAVAAAAKSGAAGASAGGGAGGAAVAGPGAALSVSLIGSAETGAFLSVKPVKSPNK